MNNEPVAWMVNDKPYKDIFEAEHYSTFTNKPMIPLYTHPHSDKSVKAKTQLNLVNVVKNHVKDLKRCVKVFRTQLLNNTANEMEVAIKELEDALYTHPADLTDEVLMQLYEVADYSPESYLEEARAILRKAQEK